MRLRFVGMESEIGGVRLNTFGQQVDLDPQVAHDCVLGHVGLIPEEDFASCGFTQDQLAYYAAPDSLSTIKDPSTGNITDKDFHAKRAKAHALATTFRVKYEADAAKGNTFMTRASVKPSPAPIPTPKSE